jgi:hypothetical protein
MKLRLLWISRRFVSDFGSVAVAGVVLLFVVLVYDLSYINAARERIASTDAEAERLLTRLRGRDGSRGMAAGEGELRQFYDYFPSESAVNGILGRVYEVAGREGIILERGEYRLVSGQVGGLLLYQATFPVKSSYSKLRRFLAAVLAQNPNVALDGIAFSRQTSTEIGVSADVRMTIYVRPD